MLVNVSALVALAQFSAGHAALIALAVLLLTVAVLAVAALLVPTVADVGLEFGLEGLGVALADRVKCTLALLFVFCGVVTGLAVAALTHATSLKALAIELEAL